jgi:carbon-monoxide dehydrogenase medium subunit
VRAFELVTAKDSGHAVALLAEHGASAKILAGGTDLLVDLKSKPEKIGVVIDISRAEDMKKIALTEDGLSLGALVTHAQIVRSEQVRKLCPALAEAAQSIGAAQTRNLGTIGGNLMTCVPSMDAGPALVALDASVTVAAPEGQRRMPVSDLFVAPRRTSLKATELLIEIVIPKRSLGKPAAFMKFGLRKGQALALVNVAASFWSGRDGSVFVEPRIALGAVAPTVMRAIAAEADLAGRAIAPEAMAQAGRIAAAEARPIDDFRASAAYRRDLVAVLTQRALAAAAERANADLKGTGI